MNFHCSLKSGCYGANRSEHLHTRSHAFAKVLDNELECEAIIHQDQVDQVAALTKNVMEINHASGVAENMTSAAPNWNKPSLQNQWKKELDLTLWNGPIRSQLGSIGDQAGG